jgi:hypothetical protein
MMEIRDAGGLTSLSWELVIPSKYMAALGDLTSWMDAQSEPNVLWYVKRLSGNDTLANGSHQAGPYVPKEILFDVFPSLNRRDTENPEKWFTLCIDSHQDRREVRAVWYNNRLRGGTRNESRVTNFGGENSALLNPESTGSLAVFAFHRCADGDASACHVWVCKFETEADLIEDKIGPVEPGKWKVWGINSPAISKVPSPRATCWLVPHEIPASWRIHFPSGLDIVRMTLKLQPSKGVASDTRLLRRRSCEFEIYRSVEENIELPLIQKGFSSIDEFVARAQTILQRRKARSGRSLELQTREIFIEEQMIEGHDFSHQPESDLGKRPDFIFPNETSYKNPKFPSSHLRMLAVKTTCKDRWRQIINEADRIKQKHLLTLQEGVSESQFREMVDAGVQLVVPAPLIDSYPKVVQPQLKTLDSFIRDLKQIRKRGK